MCVAGGRGGGGAMPGVFTLIYYDSFFLFYFCVPSTKKYRILQQQEKKQQQQQLQKERLRKKNTHKTHFFHLRFSYFTTIDFPPSFSFSLKLSLSPLFLPHVCSCVKRQECKECYSSLHPTPPVLFILCLTLTFSPPPLSFPSHHRSSLFSRVSQRRPPRRVFFSDLSALLLKRPVLEIISSGQHRIRASHLARGREEGGVSGGTGISAHICFFYCVWWRVRVVGWHFLDYCFD